MAEEVVKTTEEEIKEETTEVVAPVEGEPEKEKVGFFTKAKNGIKKFGNSKPGKVLKVVGLVGVGALGALGLSKVSKMDGDPDIVIYDLDDENGFKVVDESNN